MQRFSKGETRNWLALNMLREVIEGSFILTQRKAGSIIAHRGKAFHRSAPAKSG